MSAYIRRKAYLALNKGADSSFGISDDLDGFYWGKVGEMSLKEPSELIVVDVDGKTGKRLVMSMQLSSEHTFQQRCWRYEASWAS